MNKIMVAPFTYLHGGQIKRMIEDQFPNNPPGSVTWMLCPKDQGYLEIVFYDEHGECIGTLTLFPQSYLIDF